MRWAGHVASMEQTRTTTKMLVGKPERRDNLGDLRVDGMILLSSILKKICVRILAGFIWLGIGSSGGLL
jgi:cation transporter-like permease